MPKRKSKSTVDNPTVNSTTNKLQDEVDDIFNMNGDQSIDDSEIEDSYDDQSEEDSDDETSSSSDDDEEHETEDEDNNREDDDLDDDPNDSDGDGDNSGEENASEDETNYSDDDIDNNSDNDEVEEYSEDEGSKNEEEDVKVNQNNVDRSVDEYAENDTSDEEDIRNTVGNIPMNWYDEYKHIGYDWDGNKIAKGQTQDQLDMFLKKIEDPEFWRTVKDPQTGQDIVLSDEDVKTIRRIQGQKIPDEAFDEYAPWIEWFTSEVMKTPLRKFPEHKRSFLPSRVEAKKVSKLVYALKMGWIKTKEEEDKLRAKKEPQFYMLWQTDDQAEDMRRIHKHIPAPKRQLPGHAESYNPPPEYLFDKLELKQWKKQKDMPWKRKLHFVPQKYDSLRNVPSYSRYIKERFLRCMDLYLCPRAIRMKLTIEPDALVPKLPSPRDLQPFPNVLAIEYEGHKDMVRTIDTDKSGQYLVSGSDDCTIKIWETNTGRCLKTIDVEAIVRSVKWCPNSALSLILVAAGRKVILLNPHVGDTLVSTKTDSILKDPTTSDVIISERVRTSVEWVEPAEEEYKNGFRVVLVHFKEVTQVTWHGKGDYFASVMTDGLNRSVLISQVSKRRSQLPTSKSKGLVQCVQFHPAKPFLFVATQRYIRVYDLMKQSLVKKLLTNSRWVSSMDIHPGGDNLIVGTYDRKILWFDLEYSVKPYQTLRIHGNAVRSVSFHKRYPLFASGSDDRNLIICHGMVYNDLNQNALIVPLKRMQNHEDTNDFGIFAVHFHPLQPWVFTSGADGTIKLYSN